MLLRDFFFSIKNVHISFLEKRHIIKLFKVGLVFLYKFVLLEMILYNFFYKRNLDKIYPKNNELYNKDLYYLFDHFNSLRKKHGYAEVLEKNLNEIREKNIDILEIGTAKGDGLASFYFYFPKSSLIGIDNNPFRIRYKSKRIRNIYCDISSKNIMKNLTNHLNKKFDLIIEDCSHLLMDQINCFVENFKNLKEKGIYIVEDLNFPEIHKKYNPTDESINLKVIFQKIINKEKIDKCPIDEDKLNFIKNDIEMIKIFKCKNKKDYLVEGISEYSEIAFIKKK